MYYSEGGPSNGLISKWIIDAGWNFPPLFLFDRATILCNYNVWLYAGQSQQHVNLKIPEILKLFWPTWEPSREVTTKYTDSIFPVRILHIPTYQSCKY